MPSYQFCANIFCFRELGISLDFEIMSLSKKNNTDGIIFFSRLFLVYVVKLSLKIIRLLGIICIRVQPLYVPASNLFAETVWQSKETLKLSTNFLAVRFNNL